MTTEAGKLLRAKSRLTGFATMAGLRIFDFPDVVEAIPAIEAEAVAARNAEIAEAVRGLPDQGDHEFGWKAAVLAIVERP